MKNVFFIGWITLISIATYGQVKDISNSATAVYGIKMAAGLITTRQETTTMMDERAFTTQKIKFSSAAPQLSIGLWGQKKFGWLYADANVLYTKYGMNYEVFANNSDDVHMKTMSESFEYIDVQVTAGLTSNGFRIGVGPVAHFLANHHTDLMEVLDFNEKVRQVSYGFSGAVGYDWRRLSFDIKYDKAFRTIGDHMYYGIRKSRFLQTPDALTLSIAYQLF